MEDKTCDHDWRVDPYTHLLTMPPSQRLVCASCGAKSSRFIPGGYKPSSYDPKNWEKA